MWSERASPDDATRSRVHCQTTRSRQREQERCHDGTGQRHEELRREPPRARTDVRPRIRLDLDDMHSHIYGMKRTTVFLDEETLLRLQKAAQRTGVSAASLIREALALYLDAPATATPMPSIAGQFASGSTDNAERVDEWLWRNPHA